HGHTYGCWPIWCMWRPGLPPILARRPWYEALHLPGSSQVRHARDLLLSRPFLERIPDQSLIASDVGSGTYHVRATRDAAGRYAMVYIPAVRRLFGAAHQGPAGVELDLTSLSGTELAVWWFDPRTGVAQAAGVVQKEARATFIPPAGGPDWVLVLDDAACGFPPPGRR
ncbi:MAG: putative collagen-binding domain-containing protein, partial [Chloroflexota bacterium]